MPVSGGLVTQVSIGAVALYTLVTAASRAIDRLLALAEYYDVDEVLVGMTVLALGTSLPELSAHLVASLGILSGVLDYQVTSAGTPALRPSSSSSSSACFSSGTERFTSPGRSSTRATCRCWVRSARLCCSPETAR